MSMEFEGGAELDRALRELPLRIQRKAITESLRAGAAIVRDDARSRVPRDSGLTARDIKVRVVPRSGKTPTVAIGTSKDKKGRDYIATFIEKGTAHQQARPFLRPALDENVNAVLRKIGERLGISIEREAAKLAK